MGNAKEKPELDTTGLSEEEIAALAEDDESEAEETAEDVTDDTEEPKKPAQGEVKDENEGEKDAAEDSADDEEAEAEETEELAAQGVVDDQFTAQLKSRDVPDDIDDQIKGLQDSIEKLDARLDEGEVDYAEHAKESRKLVMQLSDLNSLQREAQLITENNQKLAADRWDWEVARFMEDNEAFKHPVVSGALNAALNELYADEENKGRSYRWFLQTASDQVTEVMNLPKTKPVEDDASGDQGEPDLSKVAQTAPKTKKAPPPKTLGGVPEADRTAESADEFAHLDSMSGLKLEQALAAMSPEKEQKYLDTRNL